MNEKITKELVRDMCEDAIGLDRRWTRANAEQLRDLALSAFSAPLQNDPVAEVEAAIIPFRQRASDYWRLEVSDIPAELYGVPASIARSLARQLRDAREDARRYRWWREKYFGSDEELDEVNALKADGPNGWDAAIDQAIAATLPATNAVQHAQDWTEDFSGENGNYSNRCIKCGIEFNGHKRRLVCKMCASSDNAEKGKP